MAESRGSLHFSMPSIDQPFVAQLQRATRGAAASAGCMSPILHGAEGADVVEVSAELALRSVPAQLGEQASLYTGGDWDRGSV